MAKQFYYCSLSKVNTDLCDVKRVISEPFSLCICHDLNVQSPCGELLIGYSIVEVSGGIVRITTSYFTCLVCWQVLDALIGLQYQ